MSRRSSCPRRGKLRYSAADTRIVSVDHQFFKRALPRLTSHGKSLPHAGKLKHRACITILTQCRPTELNEPFLSRKYSGGIRARFGLLHRGISIDRRRVPDPDWRDCPGVEIPSALP